MKKLIVTSRSVLEKKYGKPGRALIDAALASLRKADRARGITTTIFSLDPAPTGTSAERAWKKAVDEAYVAARRPDYVVLLGAPDVVPHQSLTNPRDDEDPRVPSDLPYACDAAFSRSVKDFIGPTRVVSRVPDEHRGDDPQPLLTLLARMTLAALPVGPPRAFVLTAAEWEAPSRAVLKNSGAPLRSMRVSPDEYAPTPLRPLDANIHLINCHGGPEHASFYGDGGSGAEDAPALSSGDVLGGVPLGAVAAFECCYGAELYPRIDVGRGIAETYLQEGAGAVFGSTTVAYGATNDGPEPVAADVVCGSFLKQVREGASVGRAALEARLSFVATESPLSDIELKTLAQYILLGDPAHRPFPPAGAKSGASPKPKSGAAKTAAKPRAKFVDAHAEHRTALRDTGEAQAAWADNHSLETVSADAPPTLLDIAAQMGLRVDSVVATVWTPDASSPAPKTASGASPSAVPESKRVWTLTDVRPPPPSGPAVQASTELLAVHVEGGAGAEVAMAIAEHRTVSKSAKSTAKERPARWPMRTSGMLAKETGGKLVVRGFVSRTRPR